jgi:hypothetical protein
MWSEIAAIGAIILIPLAYIGFLALVVYILIKVAMFALGWG